MCHRADTIPEFHRCFATVRKQQLSCNPTKVSISSHHQSGGGLTSAMQPYQPDDKLQKSHGHPVTVITTDHPTPQRICTIASIVCLDCLIRVLGAIGTAYASTGATTMDASLLTALVRRRLFVRVANCCPVVIWALMRSKYEDIATSTARVGELTGVSSLSNGPNCNTRAAKGQKPCLFSASLFPLIRCWEGSNAGCAAQAAKVSLQAHSHAALAVLFQQVCIPHLIAWQEVAQACLVAKLCELVKEDIILGVQCVGQGTGFRQNLRRQSVQMWAQVWARGQERGCDTDST